MDVADQYALALLGDETSHLRAAHLRWPMALPDWMRRQQLLTAHAAIGAEPTWPWDIEPEATEEEMELARRVLAERSAIHD